MVSSFSLLRSFFFLLHRQRRNHRPVQSTAPLRGEIIIERNFCRSVLDCHPEMRTLCGLTDPFSLSPCSSRAHCVKAGRSAHGGEHQPLSLTLQPMVACFSSVLWSPPSSLRTPCPLLSFPGAWRLFLPHRLKVDHDHRDSRRDNRGRFLLPHAPSVSPTLLPPRLVPHHWLTTPLTTPRFHITACRPSGEPQGAHARPCAGVALGKERDAGGARRCEPWQAVHYHRHPREQGSGAHGAWTTGAQYLRASSLCTLSFVILYTSLRPSSPSRPTTCFSPYCNS